MNRALGVLFTFTTYGTFLHGDERGSVHWRQASFGAPLFGVDQRRERGARSAMNESEFRMQAQDRDAVLNAVVQACLRRGWELLSVHVRTNHVHVVLRAESEAKRVLAYLKARATTALKSRHPERLHFWTMHGSCRFLWKGTSLQAAVRYVLKEQGAVMSRWPES